MTRRRKTRTISVQMPDIVDGVQNDPKRCTIQLAATRAFDDAKGVHIANGLMRVSWDSEDWLYEIPRNAACIPVMIDEGMRDAVEPMDFCVKQPMVIPRKSRKPVSVRTHERARPGEGEGEPNAGSTASAQQRSSGARMRRALMKHFKAKKGQSRFEGIGI